MYGSSRNGRPDWGRRIGGLAVLALVLLVALEISLRLSLGFGRPLLYTTDPAFGYLPAPNQTLHRLGAHIHINAFGMRSADLPLKPTAGARRILFVGDSVTFGTTYVDQPQIFTSRIQAYADRAAARSGQPPTFIMNASAGGWGPVNEYQFLRSRGTFGARTVVLVLNTGDLVQSTLATITDPRQYPTADPVTAIGEVLQRYVGPRLGRALSPDPGSVATPPRFQQAQAVLQDLTDIEGIVQAAGDSLVIVYSPANFANAGTPEMIRIWDAFEDWTNQSHVDLIDMTPLYRRHAARDIYLDDIHLRPLAHGLVADEFISRESQLLQPRSVHEVEVR